MSGGGYRVQYGDTGQSDDAVLGGMERDDARVHQVLRMACNLKFMPSYIWHFLFNIFGLRLTMGN